MNNKTTIGGNSDKMIHNKHINHSFGTSHLLGAKRQLLFIIHYSLFILFCSCATKSASGEAPITISTPTSGEALPVIFSADSAYLYIEQQVAFGARVPNSAAHRQCADYLIAELSRRSATLFVQEPTLTAYDNTPLKARNIIAAFNPDSRDRLLLCAHWDSRPYADSEAADADRRTPIDGADDGASGVGVLLEIARCLSQQLPQKGIDIVFFDAEDYGAPDFAPQRGKDTWCLGSQYWARNPHVPHYHATYGILLDMVGAKDAVFFRESVSARHAAAYVDKVWNTARSLGYGRYFIAAPGGDIIDDHIYIIAGRDIPCLDIIHYDPDSPTGFAPHWHTLHDKMDVIDRQTLHAVGHTLLALIYQP